MLKNVSNAHSSGFTYCIVTINMYVHKKVNHKNKHMDMFTYSGQKNPRYAPGKSVKQRC